MSAAMSEGTALAWLCEVGYPEVDSARRARGIRRSERYYRSLTDLQRLAYHLGVLVEQRRDRRQLAPTRGRCLAKVRVIEEGDRRSMVLLGFERRRLVMLPDNGLWDIPKTCLSDDPRALPNFFGHLRSSGMVVRITTWLVPVGRVHG